MIGKHKNKQSSYKNHIRKSTYDLNNVTNI